MARLCWLKTHRGQTAFFTNCRGLRLAEPAPQRCQWHWDGKRAIDFKASDPDWAQVAAERPDLAALV